MKSISTIGMDKKEWLKHRQKAIFSTDVAAILGLNPYNKHTTYKTALDIYYEKIAEKPIEIEDNPGMKAGRKFEQAIADWYCEDSGKNVRADNKIRFMDNHPFGANIDKMIIGENGHNTGLLEIKTASERAYKFWEDSIPDMYMVQVQFAMMVCNWNWGEFALWVSGMDLQIIPFEKDQELLNLAIPKLLDFWNNNVLKKVPPEAQTEKDVITLFPSHIEGKSIELSEDNYKELYDLKLLQKQYQELGKEIDKTKEQFKILMKDNEYLTYQDEVVVTYRKSKDSKYFDEKAFKVDNPELYQKYINQKQGIRRFLIK